MAKLDPRLLAGSYYTALELGVVEKPREVAFLTKEQADAIEANIGEQIKRQREIKETIQEMLKVLANSKEAKDEKEKPVG